MQLYKTKTNIIGFMVMVNVLDLNIDLRAKEVEPVVTVALVTLQSIHLFMVKHITIVVKRDILNRYVEAILVANLDKDGKVEEVVSQSCSRKDLHEVDQMDQNDDSNSYNYEQDTIQVMFGKGISKNFTSDNFTNIQFDEIDGKRNISCVLSDLTLCKASSPKDYHVTNIGIQHRFKIDSSACRNLLPLKIYKKLFAHVTRAEMNQSIDNRIQLLAYNKKTIGHSGVCYLHVKNNSCVKLCKLCS